jgi:hypothetical protein
MSKYKVEFIAEMDDYDVGAMKELFVKMMNDEMYIKCVKLKMEPIE